MKLIVNGLKGLKEIRIFRQAEADRLSTYPKVSFLNVEMPPQLETKKVFYSSFYSNVLFELLPIDGKLTFYLKSIDC